MTIGPGLPAVSFRFDGKLGILDKVTPVELGLDYIQRTDYGAGSAGETRLVLWRVALGITFGKSAGDSGVHFGAYVMPWGIQVNNSSAGVAIGYDTVDELHRTNQNFSLLLPVSYTVQL